MNQNPVSNKPTYWANRVRRPVLVGLAMSWLAWCIPVAAVVAGEAKEAVPERIEARAFLLRGTDKKLRGIFGMDGQSDPQPSLLLMSGRGGESGLIVALQHHEDTPNHVVLHLTSGKQFLQLGANDRWGSFLHLSDLDGNVRLGISTRAQFVLEGEASRWGKEAWPVVHARSKDDKIRCLFLATPEGGRCEVYNAASRRVFALGARASVMRTTSVRSSETPQIDDLQPPPPQKIGHWDYNTYGAAQTGAQQGKNR
jgi:hypothetical protein